MSTAQDDARAVVAPVKAAAEETVIHVDSILQIRQYSERTKAVYAWGKQADQKFAIDAFGEGTFEALSGICAARGALELGKQISASKFVTHPSALVRRTSVSSGLLSAAEAKAIFLSDESSRDTVQMIVRTCPSLPADEETLSLARKLDEEGGFRGGGVAWRVLSRTRDEQFFLKHAPSCVPVSRPWNGSNSQPLSLALVNRFPNAILQLANTSLFAWRFNWMAAIAQKDAEPLFKLVLSPPQSLTSQPGLVSQVVKWGWKPFFNLLLGMAERGHTGTWTRLQMLTALRDSSATFNMKLEGVLSVFPKAGQPKEAAKYIALLPRCNRARRVEHCMELLTGFWGIVATAEAAKPWDLFRILATEKILPNEVLVKEFLAKHSRTRSAPLADQQAWKREELAVFSFVLGLCKTDTERLEVLLALFGRADVVTPGGALELFLAFRNYAQSSVCLRTGFDALAATLGSKAVKTELQAVVTKMSTLEENESKKNPALRLTADGLPRNWVLFCGDASCSGSSVGLFLRSILLNLAEGALLPALVTSFGRSWFWELFATVLKGTDGSVLTEAVGNAKATFDPSLLALLATVTPITVEEKACESKATGEQAAVMDPVYRAKEEEVKKRTFGKDYLERQRAYLELVQLCANGGESSKPALYADAVPFFVKRLDREQETVKFAVLPSLLSAFPAHLWVPQAKEHLGNLWNSCFHARTCNTSWKSSFSTLCQNIVQTVLQNDWAKRPVDALEVCGLAISEVNRSIFVTLLQKALKTKHARGEFLHADAVEWCIAQALGPIPTASQVLELTTSLATAYESREHAWEQVPGLAKRWQAIHENPIAPSLLEFLLVGTPKYFVTYNSQKKAEDPTHKDWCGPLLEPAYVSVCSKTLAKLPELVGAETAMQLCKERLVQVNFEGLPLQMRVEIREEAIQTATNIVNTTRGTGLRACLEHALAISTAGTFPGLPSADRLLAAGLDAMDAVIEGRARVVASIDSEFAARWGPSTLLANMLDSYLTTSKPEVLDRRVLELCNRADAHLLLFFGSNFSKHLCLRRQAELHSFLGQLAVFPSEATQAQDFEFFHWELPEHSLAPLTALPLTMLHPATQTLLLQKGLLGNTLLPTLTALPTLAYVDTNPDILAILDAHPRPQSPAKAVDPSLKPLNPKDPNDLNELVQCRYRSLAPPTRTDEVQQKHVDTLILALGHADHTDRAMVVLSKYAGWHKFARDALVRTIKTLAKPHARRVLAQLVTPSKDADEKTGLSTLVHMLRLALELRVDRVVDLCRDAFREGKCHRDVLAVMLTKLVVLEDLSADELRTIRSFYNISSSTRDKADKLYIVHTTLQDIKNLKPWTLPFVCEVISTDWCYVPGAASEAFSALLTAVQCGAPVTAVVEAMTCMLRSARVLANVDFHDSHTLAADWKSVDSSQAAAAFRGQTSRLAECNLGTLRALVREVFSGPTRDLQAALNLWVPLARDDLKEVDWVAARIKEFSTRDLGSAFQVLVDTTINEGGQEVAKKAVHIAREAVGPTTAQGVKLLISGWAKLVARDSDKAALEALLRDETANENVVAVVRVLFHGPHRWQALEWLSRSRPCSEAPAPGLADLVDLGAQVFAEKGATLDCVKKVLELMASHGDSPLCISLIEKLADKGPANRDVQRLGLQWLTPLFPRAAVRFYPNFLSRFEPHSITDVDDLLALCVKNDLEVPPLTQGVCRVGCASLLQSSRVEARVLAARALAKDQRFEELKLLLEDSSAVVRSAAQSLLPSAP